MALSQIDLWIVGVYLAVTLAIGLYFGWKTDSFKDFAIGDRKIGTMALFATMFATFTGASSALGVTENVFKLGLVFVFIALGWSIFKLIESFIFARMDKCLKKAVSPGDIVGYFYGKPGKLVTGVVIVITATGFLGAQVKAISYLFEYFLGSTSIQGVFLGAGLVVIYSSLGGMRAVVATDILQFAMLAVALPFLVLWALWQAGGPEAIKVGVPTGHLNFFPHGPDAGKHLSTFALFCFPMMHATVLQRLLMAKEGKQAAKAWQITAVAGAIFHCIAGLIGLIVVTANAGLEPRLAMPWLIQHYTSPGIYGVMIVGLLAIVMSSADSILHVTSVSLTHDVIAPLRNEPLASKAELRLAQAASLVTGFLAICSTLWFNDILSITVAFWSLWVVIIPLPLIAAVFGFRASTRTFLLAVGAGVITSLGWDRFAPPGAIGAFVPSILVHSLVFFVARMFDPSHIRIKKKPDGKTVVEAGAEKISTLSEHSAQRHAWRHGLFAIYLLFLYMVPMGLASAEEYKLLTPIGFFMSALVCLLAFPSLFAEDYSPWIKRRMPLYWKTALTLCLPMASTFMLLHEPNHLRWMFSTPVCIFLLSVMLPWKQYLVSLPVGIILGTAAAALLGGPNTLHNAFTELPIWVWFNLPGVCIVCFVSAYYTQTLEEKILDIIRFGFSQSVHDGLTPAAEIRNRADTIQEHLPFFLELYDKALKEGTVKPLDPAVEAAMRAMPKELATCAHGNLSYWTMLLHNTRGKPRKTQLRVYLMSDLVKEALQFFPFASKEERKRVTIVVKKDMHILVDRTRFCVLVHNLVNNATFFMRQKPGSRMRITIDANDNGGKKGMGSVRFWDNAKGMSDEVASNMFTPRFSTREGGSGWGMTSALEIVTDAQGVIRAETKENEFTEIITFFLIHNEGDSIPQDDDEQAAGHSRVRALQNQLKSNIARQEQLQQFRQELQQQLDSQKNAKKRAVLEQHLRDTQEMKEMLEEQHQEILEEMKENSQGEKKH